MILILGVFILHHVLSLSIRKSSSHTHYGFIGDGILYTPSSGLYVPAVVLAGPFGPHGCFVPATVVRKTLEGAWPA